MPEPTPPDLPPNPSHDDPSALTPIKVFGTRFRLMLSFGVVWGGAIAALFVHPAFWAAFAAALAIGVYVALRTRRE